MLIAAPLIVLAVPAPITDAIVYSDEARVTRTAQVTASGRTAVELPLLPAAARPDSVRLETAGALEVETVEIRAIGPGQIPRDRASATLAALDQLDDAIAQADRERVVLARLAEIVTWRPSLGDEIDQLLSPGKALPRLDGSGWAEAITFAAGYAGQVQAQLRHTDESLRVQRDQRAVLVDQARGLAEGSDRRLRVVATIRGHGAGTLRLSYLVSPARWTPAYEVRLDPRSERVTVALAGLVTQRTGEDWEGTRLTLSTALAAHSTALPALPSWRIGEPQRFIPAPRPAPAEPEAPLAPPESGLSADQRLRQALLARVAAAAAAPSPGGEAPAPAAPTVRASVANEIATGGYGGGQGRIVGYVFDQTGAPIKGVRISLGGGARRVYSNDEGAFRLLGLPPGKYDLAAQAPKLATVYQNGITVSGTTSAEVNLVMEVSSQVEEVKVIEHAPLVSTTSANVKETFDLDIEGVPTGVSHGERTRDEVALAVPAGWTWPRLPADAPAVLAGGHEIAFRAVAAETVRSGEDVRRVPLASWSAGVAVERSAFPALAPSAFLVASLANPTRDVLPAGTAALFVGDDPAGTANLKLSVPGERVTLPLGVDRAVKPVRRVTVETRREGLVRKEEISLYTVTTEITNPHPHPLRLTVRDQIPVSPDETVQVRLEASAPAATLDRPSGALGWTLTVPPGRTTTVSFAYSLRRPTGRRLHQ